MTHKPPTQAVKRWRRPRAVPSGLCLPASPGRFFFLPRL